MKLLRHNLRKRGSVLVAVLGLIAFLSALLVSFLGEATERIKYSGLLDSRVDLRTHAYSALEVVLAVINEVGEIDKELRSPTQGWANPFEYSGLELPDDISVRVEFEDESGKLPLAKLAHNDLLMLFDRMEISRREAERLADSLFDWMDADDLSRLNGMDGDDYRRHDPPIRPANAVPQSWEEFFLIDGFRDVFQDEGGKPNALFSQFRNAISLYSTDSVNLNTASQLVLETYAWMSGADIRMLEDRLSGDDRVRGTMDDLLMTGEEDFGGGENAPSWAGYKTNLLQIRIQVSYGEARYLLTALVKWKGVNAANIGTGLNSFSDTTKDATKDFKQQATQLGYPFEIVRIIENQRI